MIFCICNNVTEAHLRAMALEVSGDPEQVAVALGLYSEKCCGRCADELPEMLPALQRPAGTGR